MSEKMTEESYIIVYSMIFSQNLTQKWSKTVYNSIYYHLQSKIDWNMSRKNEWRIIYNSIYYHLQSKFDSKMTQKMK